MKICEISFTRTFDYPFNFHRARFGGKHSMSNRKEGRKWARGYAAALAHGGVGLHVARVVRAEQGPRRQPDGLRRC